MSENTVNGKVAIAGIAETAYYKRGAADHTDVQELTAARIGLLPHGGSLEAATAGV